MTIDRKTFLRRLGAAGLVAAVGTPRLNAQPGETSPWPPVRRASDPAGFWRQVRAQYPIMETPVYFNCGGLGPSPRPVLDIFDVTARALQHRVDTGHFFFEQARSIAADFLGATPDEICFTRNATEGNGIIASGLDLRPGDEVIFESHAHPGGSLPWLNEARQRGIVVKVFQPDETSAAGNLEQIAAKLTPRTKVIQVSHITATTGLVMPVKAIAALAREKNLWFHIDGAQSAGMIPVNLHAIDCDSYATSGHKWLGGPRETGVLYLRAARVAEVAPRHVGAYSSADFDFQGQLNYTDGARRHEYGTRSAAGVVALAEAMRFQITIGRERIAEYGAGLSLRVQQGLAQIKGVRVLSPVAPELRSSMTTFAIEGKNAAQMFGFLLEKHGFRCRPVTEAGLDAVRISTHVFNDTESCDRVVGAVTQLSALA